MRPSRRVARLVALLGLPLVLAAFAAEGRFGTTRYRLAGTAYAVPHTYEFSRNFRLPWLDALPGLGREPADSLWLMLPAAEVAAGLPGYSPLSHGHTGPFEADLVVHVVGDPDGRRFAPLHARQWGIFDARLAQGAPWRPDPSGGERLIHSEGVDHRRFYRLPSRHAARPADQAPPGCLASDTSDKREVSTCTYLVHRDGLTYDFSLRPENLAVADRVPAYVLARLVAWKRPAPAREEAP